MIPALRNELEAYKILEEKYNKDGALSFISQEVDILEKAISVFHSRLESHKNDPKNRVYPV